VRSVRFAINGQGVTVARRGAPLQRARRTPRDWDKRLTCRPFTVQRPDDWRAGSAPRSQFAGTGQCFRGDGQASGVLDSAGPRDRPGRFTTADVRNRVPRRLFGPAVHLLGFRRTQRGVIEGLRELGKGRPAGPNVPSEIPRHAEPPDPGPPGRGPGGVPATTADRPKLP